VKPEDFSRDGTRFYVNSAWVNFSSCLTNILEYRLQRGEVPVNIIDCGNPSTFCHCNPHSDISLFRLLDQVSDVERKPTGLISFFHHTVSDPADFFGGLLGANVIFADVKNDVLNKIEGMSQH